MKPYPKYKPSGVEWIGEIPEHWNIKPLGVNAQTIVPMRDKPTIFNGNVPWIRIEDFDGKFISDSKSGQYVSDELIRSMNLKVYPIGTVLCSCSCIMGTTAIVKKPLISNQTFIGIVPYKQVISDYIYYLMQVAKNHLQIVATGAIQQYLSRNDFKNLRIPVPPLIEQLNIKQFLELTTSQIDSLISKKQRLIDFLKEERAALINQAVTKGLNPDVPMKDSGIEWLGEIPAHWEVKKLKYVCSVKGRIGFRGYTTQDLVSEGEGALTLGATHINKSGSIVLEEPVYISWEKYYESPEIMVNVGDLLIVQRGSTCGKLGIIIDDISPATINPSLVLLKPFKINSRYLFYSMQSNLLKNMLNMVLSSTAIPMLSQELIYNLPTLFPSSEEQENIVIYIEKEVQNIDTTIEFIDIEINLLQEYRTALISEVVTGKIDVRSYTNEHYNKDAEVLSESSSCRDYSRVG